MSAAPQIRTALMENLKALHLPAMRECFEQAKLLLKQVEGHAKAAGREQLIAVPVMLEGARLAHQPVDDVPVIHAMLLQPTQVWHLGDLLLSVPAPHMIHE